MKTFKLLSIVLLLVLVSCNWEVNTEKYYTNIDLKIISINSNNSLSQDKFHTPQTCNIILFVTTDQYPPLYREMNTCKIPYNIHINTKWLYNHKAGDIVHFDYLLKSEFFTIDRLTF